MTEVINTVMNPCGDSVPIEGWYFNQIKGTGEDLSEADIISCVEYDKTGEFLATGDRGGRIVVFKRETEENSQNFARHNVYCTFVSHEPEFDYLKSLEIEEKINKIRWLPRTNHARFLLSTNDKTVKLWRITERHKRATGFNLAPNHSANQNNAYSNSIHNNNIVNDDESQMEDSATAAASSSSHSTPCFRHANDVKVPQYENIEPVVDAYPRRIFANAHAYLINSLSVNSDQETFLSADDLRVNLWNLEITDQSFNIVDLKPTNMEELTEVITAAQFHPSACSLFIYGSSKGAIRLCDMRQRALCDDHALSFEEVDDPTNRGFFSEIINNISDLNFSHSGRYILSRNYLTLKVWDLTMTHKPLETYLVHDYFRSRLCGLYENDCIFDKFECQWSPDDRYLVTGSYNNHFRVFDRLTGQNTLMQATREAMRSSVRGKLTPCEVTSCELSPSENKISVECMDLTKKLLHLSWHPRENTLALAGTSVLYLLDYYPPKIEDNGDSPQSDVQDDVYMDECPNGVGLSAKKTVT